MKIQILDSMKTERLGNRLWGLLSEFRVLIDGDLFTVPAWFVTDGASTPRFLWSIYPPVAGPFGEGALIHDYFYSIHSQCDDRKLADTVLFEVGRMRGANLLRAWAVYSAVRAFGWMRWKKS